MDTRGVIDRIRRALRPAAGSGQRGMTLIEIMVVVVIMALIASGVAVAVVPQLRKAQIKTTCVRINDIRTAVEIYMVDNNECPSIEEIKPDLKGDPVDSWNNEFKVECGSEDDVVISSAGKDGNFGTDDDLDEEACRTIVKGKKGE